MKILALNPQTDMLLGELNNRGNKIFTEDKHIKEIDGENSFQFITPIGIKEAKFFDQRSRILIPSETGSFEEFIVFHTNESMDDKKQVVSTAAYTEMDKEYVISPGTYVGTLAELANEALEFTTYDLGIYESIQRKTIVVTEHVGVYTYLSRVAKEFELEMPIRTETSGTRFTGRFVDFVKRIGPDLKRKLSMVGI
ncbi:hypothetical protein B481_1990 [Planococcus halocryophilus Or1]|uniref:hypothetical protein n=1 Tax=Planococcus halocryophilus TaxID=1215089 RepID=UPI0002B89415|nr:hypothetical protein [Planococcus halocryophilus]EMF46263.1 hypothetical protein B481_1990 [Planococcus halocryophilus Or1]